MSRRLAIAMFVDACGWGVVEPRPWLSERLGYRRRVQSIFGYSSACVPAILTGRHPNETDHWSAFYYSPKTSPFRHLRYLRVLLDRGRYTGYFQLYNLPWARRGPSREHLSPVNDDVAPQGICTIPASALSVRQT